MVNTEIRLVTFFAAKDAEALYSQQKQDQELTVTQVMNSLLPNSDFKLERVGKKLTQFSQENLLVIANTLVQQHKRRPYTWTSPDGQHRNQIDYILCSPRWRSSIQSAKTRPGANCDSDHELLIAIFRLKLKKVGKTTRPLAMT